MKANNMAIIREALKAVKDGIETDVLLPYGELAAEGKYVVAAEIYKKVLSSSKMIKNGSNG